MEGWPAKVDDANLDRVPARTWAQSLAGFIYSNFYSLMPVYLKRTGFSTDELATFMGVALIRVDLGGAEHRAVLLRFPDRHLVRDARSPMSP